jgi:glucoamylase
MNNFLTLILLTASLSFIQCFTISLNDSLTTWISNETQTALSAMMRNIGYNSPDPEFPTGVVIASPSTDRPNYYYQIFSLIFPANVYWTRDTALTFQYIARLYQGQGSQEQLELFQGYINETRILQHLDTLSGNFTTGGIGEPKLPLYLLELKVDFMLMEQLLMSNFMYACLLTVDLGDGLNRWIL